MPEIPDIYVYILFIYLFNYFILFFFFGGGGGVGVSSRWWAQAYVARTDESTHLGGNSDLLLSTFNIHV